MSRRSVKIPFDYEEKCNKYMINVEEGKLLDFELMFGNNNPVHIEIGSGRGEFLTKKSLDCPNINFIGIELNNHRLTTIMKKMPLDQYNNVKLLNHYVDDDIKSVIPKGSIDVIYIQHPDPWPKKKHHKYRLITQRFIDALNYMLPVGGKVEIATDHKEYSEWIVEHFSVRSDYKAMFESGFTMEKQPGHIETYFEELKRGEGHPPIFMFYKKLTDELPHNIEREVKKKFNKLKNVYKQEETHG